MTADDAQWFWCLRHDRAEQGQGCRAADRLGPYPTAAAAADWRATRDAREDEWESEDERWEGDGGS